MANIHGRETAFKLNWDLFQISRVAIGKIAIFNHRMILNIRARGNTDAGQLEAERFLVEKPVTS
jgi:hypothetical protein